MKTNSDPRLWDNSDPDYAPGLLRDRRKGHCYWAAGSAYKKAGYNLKTVRLGKLGANDPLPREWAAKCRELQREVIQWHEDMQPRLQPGTWHHLIARYKSDEFSPFHSVKANTRDSYRYWLDQIDAVMGAMPVESTTYETLMRIKDGKAKKGRSVHHIHSWFSALRRVARYGVLVDTPGAARMAEILSNMRIPTPAARSTAATREQVEAIVAAADAKGMRSFAAGILIQWWFGLRAVDVRGQVLDGEWQDGLTWGMFDGDITGFHKVISKTAKSLPEAYHFDITVIPGLRQRLLEMRAALHPHWIQPHMPVALNTRSGKAYTPSGWTSAWATLRAEAGVPEDVWCMDTRAGAITDAAQIPGVSLSQLRNAAQHKDASTTGRYIRERSTDANRIVQLRASRA